MIEYLMDYHVFLPLQFDFAKLQIIFQSSTFFLNYYEIRERENGRKNTGQPLGCRSTS
jgi:hypothetical protein